MQLRLLATSNTLRSFLEQTAGAQSSSWSSLLVFAACHHPHVPSATRGPNNQAAARGAHNQAAARGAHNQAAALTPSSSSHQTAASAAPTSRPTSLTHVIPSDTTPAVSPSTCAQGSEAPKWSASIQQHAGHLPCGPGAFHNTAGWSSHMKGRLLSSTQPAAQWVGMLAASGQLPVQFQQRAGMAILRRKLKAVRNIRNRHRYDQVWPTKKLSRKQQKMFKKNRNVYVADLGRGISLRSKLEVLKQFFTGGTKKIPYPVMRNALYEPDLHLESVGEAAKYLRIRRGRIMFARKLQSARKLAILLGNLNRQTMLQMYKRSLDLAQPDRRWAFITAVESRLDMNVLRMGFAENILAAQQMVRHNRFTLNGGPINLRGQMVKPGDVIAARADSSAWLSNYLGSRLNVFFDEMVLPFTKPSVVYDVPTIQQQSTALLMEQRATEARKAAEEERLRARAEKEEAKARAAAADETT